MRRADSGSVWVPIDRESPRLGGEEHNAVDPREFRYWLEVVLVDYVGRLLDESVLIAHRDAIRFMPDLSFRLVTIGPVRVTTGLRDEWACRINMLRAASGWRENCSLSPAGRRLGSNPGA